MTADKAKLKREKAEKLLKDLKKAHSRLKEATLQPPTVFNQDSTIKRFEFTFEMAWKIMKTIVELEGLSAASPKQAIRQAAAIGLIDNPKAWFEFLENRNLTVHTYKEEVAQQVYKTAKEFVKYAEELMGKIKDYLE